MRIPWSYNGLGWFIEQQKEIWLEGNECKEDDFRETFMHQRSAKSEDLNIIYANITLENFKT